MDNKDEWKQMIVDCQKRKFRMNEWQQKFINSIEFSIHKNPLTAKQIEILNMIWDKVT